jgi:hypothetical protein
LSTGINKYTNDDLSNNGLHAEHNAINNLQPSKTKGKKLEVINILVLRFSKTGNIKNSKPCSNCINRISSVSQIKGYKVKHVYYSNEDCGITCSTLKELQLDDNKHQSRLAKNKILLKNL